MDVYDRIRDERARAHAKHGNTSMESAAVDDPQRLAILVEEVGEVAKDLNELRHHDALGDVCKAGCREGMTQRLAAELVQVAAMAAAWAAALYGEPLR